MHRKFQRSDELAFCNFCLLCEFFRSNDSNRNYLQGKGTGEETMSLHSIAAHLSVSLQNADVPGWVLLLAGILFAGAGVVSAILLIRKNKK